MDSRLRHEEIVKDRKTDVSQQYSLMWVPIITVEKVENSKKVLDLPDICSRNEIRSAYLSLAKKWHPDVCKKNPQKCERKFRKISNAWNFLKYLMEHYRYSLREEDIRRYQEKPEISHDRHFGGGIWQGEIEDENRFLDSFMSWDIRLTAENVSFARELLELLELSTKDSVKARCQEILLKIKNERNGKMVRNAAAFLLELLENYRYILTPQAIRKDQEDPLAWHRRQFSNEPLWSGGIYDHPFYENYKSNKEKLNGKFKGIC